MKLLLKLKKIPLAVALILGVTPLTQVTAQTDTELSDGSALYLEKSKIWVTPPAGWEILKDRFGKALIMQEPKSEEIVYDKPTYQRNITVAIANEATPIDATTIATLKENLNESFGKYGKDFSLAAEHELFDYRTKKDGVIIYSFLKVNGFDLTQLHVYVSGKDQNVLSTYTDLTERFDAGGEDFAKAWNALTSIQVEGVPEPRFQRLIFIGGGIAGLIVLMIIVALLRHYLAKRSYESEEDALFEDDGEIKKVAVSDENDDDDDLFEGFDDEETGSAVPATLSQAEPLTSW